MTGMTAIILRRLMQPTLVRRGMLAVVLAAAVSVAGAAGAGASGAGVGRGSGAGSAMRARMDAGEPLEGVLGGLGLTEPTWRT